MKKFTEKSLKIIQHVNNEIGIDVTKYQNPEIIGKVTDLILIQNYSVKSFYKPVLISFLIYATGFFVFDFGKIGIFIYGFIGVFFFLFNGLIYGVLKLLSNLKKDLKFIINSSLDFTRNICADLNYLSTNVKEIKNPIALVFEGIVAATVTPTLTKTFVKIPVVGGLFMGGSDKVFIVIIDQLKKHEDKSNIKKFIGTGSNQLTDVSSNIDNFINSFSGKTDNILNTGFRAFQFPIRVLFVCSIIMSFLFLLSFSIL